MSKRPPHQMLKTVARAALVFVTLTLLVGGFVGYSIYSRMRTQGWLEQVKSSLETWERQVEEWGARYGNDYTRLNGYALQISGGPNSAPADFQPVRYQAMEFLRITATGDRYCLQTRHRFLSEESDWKVATLIGPNGDPSPSDMCT